MAAPEIEAWARDIDLYSQAISTLLTRATEDASSTSYVGITGGKALPLATGRLRMLAIADHALALSRVLAGDDPTPRMAPFTLLRSMLESAAVAAWLWEPGLTPADRDARGTEARGSNLREVWKHLKDPKTKAIWDSIGNVHLPNWIDLMNTVLPTPVRGATLQGEFLYRGLSGRSHGELWATIAGEIVAPAGLASSWVKLEFDPTMFRDDAVQVLGLVERAVRFYGQLAGVANDAWFDPSRPRL